MKYRKLKGYKYQLAEPEFIRLPHLAGLGTIVTPHIILLPSGMCMARTGYLWDGPSGPTLDDDTNMLPSLWHDIPYHLMRQGLIPLSKRKECDQFFTGQCLERDMSRFRAWRYLQGVRLAKWAAERRDRKEPQNVVYECG